LASYHVSNGTSSIESATIDIESLVSGTIVSTLESQALSGSAQNYIKYKQNAGDSWTRINDVATVSGTFRYICVGATTTNGIMFVPTLGEVSVGVDSTDNFVKFSVFNDTMAWT
jgi:hypothetical protein